MIQWPAPAKINLFLHVLRRRDDGYHDLQTAFQFLDYSDSLQFEVTSQPTIQLVTSLSGVDDNDNLIVRAARLLQQHTKSEKGANILLNKRLPMGGGLGGGSSNAATTLVALNYLWQCQLTQDELACIGLEIGADVPIFIHGLAAWAEGVGEKLISISPVEPWYIVIIPNCHVSTAEIFSSAELTRDCEPITIPRFLSGEGINVCETVVQRNYPEVARANKWLQQFARARMTGTGACVFASFSSKVEAQEVLNKLPDDWRGFVAKGCNQSPLAALLLKNNIMM